MGLFRTLSALSIATSQGAEGREGPKKEILVWLLSKEVYYKLIPKKSKKFIKEFYELGLKRTEAVKNGKTPLDSNLLRQEARKKFLSFKHGLQRTGRIILAEPKTPQVEPRAMEKPS